MIYLKITFLVAVGASLAASRLVAQDTLPETDIPGMYRAKVCNRADFPAELPPLESVLDTAQFAGTLRTAGVTKRIIFSLRFAAEGTTPDITIVEKKVSVETAVSAAEALRASLKTAPPGQHRPFRVKVDGQRPSVTLERSEVCGGSSRATERNLAPAVTTVTVEQTRGIRSGSGGLSASDMRSAVQQIESRLRSMRHQVLVDANGRVWAVELLNSSGEPQIDSRTTDALKRSSFTPTLLDGVPVTAWIEVGG